MTRPTGAGVLLFLVRSEKVLRSVAPTQADEVQGFIATVRALPRPAPLPLIEEEPPPPLRHLAKQLAAPRPLEAFPAQEPATNPAKPKTQRAPRKRHLRLVPPPIAPMVLVPIAVRKEAPPDPIGDRMREAEGARALLLEIVRRAAYDWVLYRSSSRLDQKILAEDAYTWLFEENEEHPHWKVRKEDEKLITGFVSICEAMDLGVEKVRSYIRQLTPNRVMSSGRPPENSRSSDHTPNIAIHTKTVDIGGTGESVDYDAIINQLLDFTE